MFANLTKGAPVYVLDMRGTPKYYTYIDGEELYRYKVHSISNGIAEVSMGVAGDNITLEIKLQKK